MIAADCGRVAGLALIAEGYSSLHGFELEAAEAKDFLDDPARDDTDEAEADSVMDRLCAFHWAIAEAPAKTHQDMAVKVRQIAEGINKGKAAWDQRTVETLLEALES